MKKLLLAALLSLTSALSQAQTVAFPGPGAGSSGDPSWASVVALVANNNGTSGTTTFTDQSTSAKTVTTSGAAVWSNTSPPTGLTTTAAFDGSANTFLSLADSADWDFGSGDFTVELTITQTTTAGSQTIVGQYNGGAVTNASWLVYLNSGAAVFYATSNGATWDICSAMTIGTLTVNTAYTIAITRSGTNIRTFLNGTLVSTVSSSAAINNSTNTLRIGASTAPGEYLKARIGSLRITKGVARYTTTYTPSALPLTSH